MAATQERTSKRDMIRWARNQGAVSYKDIIRAVAAKFGKGHVRDNNVGILVGQTDKEDEAIAAGRLYEAGRPRKTKGLGVVPVKAGPRRPGRPRKHPRPDDLAPVIFKAEPARITIAEAAQLALRLRMLAIQHGDKLLDEVIEMITRYGADNVSEAAKAFGEVFSAKSLIPQPVPSVPPPPEPSLPPPDISGG